MAKVKIMYWKDTIPYGVRAFDEHGKVTRQLPNHFIATVDAAAMVDGDTDQNAYRDGFTWGAAEERAGTAEEAAAAVVDEIIAAYPMERLSKLVQGLEA
jgi:hypothetical protein